MKAILWKGGRTFEPGEVDRPVPGPEQVLIEVDTASICTTDFHYEQFECKPPIVPGHEVAGTVIEVGEKVDSIECGQKVTVDPVQRCGKCPMCVSGIPHLCTNIRHLGNSETPGGWAQYLAADAANVYEIPQNVSMRQAALTEPAAVCLESFKRADFRPNQTVLVLGDGVFGFIHTMFAGLMGAKRIVVAGHHDKRLARIAEATDAVTCNTHKQNLSEIISREVGETGIDLAIEATGAGQAPNIGLNSLRPRGTLVLFSYVWQPEILDLGLIHMRELNVLGACRSLGCFKECLNMMAEGRLNMEKLIDIEVPLQQIQKALTKLRENRDCVFKAVLHPK